jgi:glyceraldehyde 3-phosphate dehydrogenase
MIRVAINGFGRIGRSACKIAWGFSDMEIVAINDLTPPDNLAYLLKHDSNYGNWNIEVKATEHELIIGSHAIPVFAEKDPAKLPWEKLQVDIVLECTGLFLTEELAMAHIKAGAKKVMLSAPAKDDSIPTYVRGVNDAEVGEDDHLILSNASCTTNCVAPVTAVIEETFGIERALLTTVHGYTASQSLVDAPKKDWREGRAAAENVVPTTTGAAKAVAKTIPSLKGKFDGLSVRVPLSTVSLSDMVFVLKRPTTKEEINAALEAAAATDRFKGILGVSREPLVSSDYRGDARSSIVDAELTNVIDGTLVKVVAWYDNEWGYANRLVEIARKAVL